jgi:WD40 repeat protein
LQAAFSPDGERVVTASDDGTARLWLVHLSDLLELAELRLPVTLNRHMGRENWCAVLPLGQPTDCSSEGLAEE